MAAPDVIVEANLNGWKDITTSVRIADGVSITRGRGDEAAVVDRGMCAFSLQNRNGDYAPRNPVGPNYGYLTRNTPVRVSVSDSTSRLECPSFVDYVLLPGSTSAHASTPDSTGLSITGDLDLRVDCDLWDWTSTGELVGKWSTTPSMSYRLSISSGNLVLYWSADGTTVLSATSTLPIPEPVTGRKAVRATLDVNNGSSGWTATLYTADTLADTWVQLGEPVTGAGVTSIFNGTQTAIVGYDSPRGTTFFGLEIRAGLAGAIRANPDFTACTEAAATVTDSIGNVWTPGDGAKITKRSYRFTGMMAEWPPKWNRSGTDVTTRVTAYGYLRRITNGPALRSTYNRAMTALWTSGAASSRPVAYWPCEDQEGAESIASGIPNVATMYYVGVPTLANDGGFACSEPLPTMNGASFTGKVPQYTSTGTIRVSVLCAIPAGGAANGAVLLRVYTTGTAARWDLVYTTGGGLSLYAYDPLGIQILANGPAGYALNGTKCRLTIVLQQSGSDVGYYYARLGVGVTVGNYTPGTLSGRTASTASSVTLNANRALTDTVMGQVVVQTSVGSVWDQSDALAGHANESAANRFLRLCGEEAIEARVAGDADDTLPMGPQLPDIMSNLLRECEATSGSVIFESRRFNGLVMRPPGGLSSQPVRANLDYTNLQDLGVTDDDQLIVNDVTVSRRNGSSYRTHLDEGPLSVNEPPLGIGTASRSASVNVAGDALLPDMANWLLSQGTCDAPRFPKIDLNLLSDTFTAGLRDDVRDLDVGDRIAVTSTPVWVSTDDVSAMFQGVTETIGITEHRLQINCSPEQPWHIAKYDDTASRYSSQGSVLSAAPNTTTTSLAVSTPVGPGWTHADGDYDIGVGGERMTVTNVTGTAPSQAFTVVRSVNGVVKAHSINDVVELWRPVRYGL